MNLLWNAVRMKSYQDHTIRTFKLIREYVNQTDSKISNLKGTYGEVCNVPFPNANETPIGRVSTSFLADLQYMIDRIKESLAENMKTDANGRAINAEVFKDQL
jgi:hypothetical protein